MKLTNAQLAVAIDHAGMDFDRPSMTVLIPGDDYYGETDGNQYEGSIAIEVRDVSEWGNNFGVGRYHKPASLRDIAEALCDAVKDNFPKLVLFVEKPQTKG